MAEDDSTEGTPEGSVVEQPEIPKQLPELTDLDLLSSKVTELEAAVNQYKDQLLRKAAEFENYKKRTENDYASLVKFSNEDLVLKLLPVLDDPGREGRADAGKVLELARRRGVAARVAGGGAGSRRARCDAAHRRVHQRTPEMFAAQTV